MTDYIKIAKKFKKARILTIGDVMLDKYIWGTVERISPEAPVQVVDVNKETFIPGGAANVANNIAALCGRAWVLGITGEDESKEILKDELLKRQIDPIFITENRPTTKKVRIIGQRQQLLRLDFEKRASITEKSHKKILKYVREVLPNIDCIVLSDYAKGIATRELVEELLALINGAGKKLIVDPKPRNMRYFKNVDLITPNHKEASEAAGIEEEDEEDLLKIGKKLLKTLSSNILITRGEKGMSLFEKTGKITHIPTRAQQVFDVTGAGDTVISVVALALACGASYADAAAIANYAAGIVVGKVGTATITIEELIETLRKN